MKKEFLLFCLIILTHFSYGQENLSLSEASIYKDRVRGSIGFGFPIEYIGDRKFLTGYLNINQQGEIKLGKIDENCNFEYLDSIIFFSEFPTINSLELLRLSNSTFLIAYKTNNKFVLRTGNIRNEQDLVLGEELVLENRIISSPVIAHARINDTRFLIAFRDPETERGRCILFSISSDQIISLESEALFSSTALNSSSSISMDIISNEKFIISYGYRGGKSVIGTLKENSFQISPEFSFKSDNLSINSVNTNSLNDSTCLITYVELEEFPYTGESVIARLDTDTTLEYSNPFLLNDGSGVRDIVTTKLSDHEIIISYNKDQEGTEADAAYLTKGMLNNNQVLFSEDILITENIIVNSNFPLSRISDEFFLVQFLREGSPEGFIKLGSTNQLGACVITNTIGEKPIDNFQIYPNPVYSNLEIYHQNDALYTVSISDNNGRIIFTKKNNFDHSSIDLSHIPNGIYYLTITIAEKIISKKIIIQH